MSFMELISLFASIASLVLAVIAIWLALHHKKESDSVNEATKNLLMDVHSDAKAISSIAMPELQAYGETMRKFVFEVKKPQDTSETYEALESIKTELESLKDTNNLSNHLASKIESIEGKLKEQRESRIEELEVDEDHLLLDLSEIGFGHVSSPIEQFTSLQDLLDMIWVSFLNKEVSSYTYGETWILRDPVTNDPVNSKGKKDLRPLIEVGIMGGMRFKVEIL